MSLHEMRMFAVFGFLVMGAVASFATLATVAILHLLDRGRHLNIGMTRRPAAGRIAC